MEEDKKHNQTRRLEAFRELVEMLDSIETCRHTAFDVALQSVGPREDCKHFCDRCNDPKGLEERAKNRQHRSNFPLLNKFGENDDQLLSYDDDYDLVDELWEALTTLDSQEESTAEEERPIRGLGWRSGDPDLVAEGYELAQFYHTCGHCEATGVDSIMGHLVGSRDCLRAYMRGIFEKDLPDPIPNNAHLELALIMGACLNPMCQIPHYGRKNFEAHLKGQNNNCRGFYENILDLHDENEVTKELGKRMKNLQGKTKFRGSSAADCPPELKLRGKNAERQRLNREKAKREKATDLTLALSNLKSAEKDVLRIECSVCWQKFTRRHNGQALSAVKLLPLDKVYNTAPEHLMNIIGGALPADHLLHEDQHWYCSACEKQIPATSRHNGNLQLFSTINSQESMATMKMCEREENGRNQLVLVPSPNYCATKDVDGAAIKINPNTSLMEARILVPADSSGMENFRQDYPNVVARDWSGDAQLLAHQNIAPGSIAHLQLLYNYMRCQILTALKIREKENKEKEFGLSIPDGDGGRPEMQKQQFSKKKKGQQNEEDDKENEYKGALRDISGTSDYFDAREEEVRSKAETLGAVRLQQKIELFDGHIDGKTAASLLKSSLLRYQEHTDPEAKDRLLDFDVFLRCTQDGLQGCNFKEECPEVHTKLDDVIGLQDPNFLFPRIQLLARHLSETAKNVIDHLFRDRSRAHDMRIQFEDDRVFLVGNIWQHHFDKLNEDIAAGIKTEYMEVLEGAEDIIDSPDSPMQPTATLDVNSLYGETNAVIKNIDEFGNKLENTQKCEDLQGMPSLIPFFPRHRGKPLSEETKSNAEALLMEIATYGQETETLEDWLKKYEFKMVDDDDSGALLERCTS